MTYLFMLSGKFQQKKSFKHKPEPMVIYDLDEQQVTAYVFVEIQKQTELSVLQYSYRISPAFSDENKNESRVLPMWH